MVSYLLPLDLSLYCNCQSLHLYGKFIIFVFEIVREMKYYFHNVYHIYHPLIIPLFFRNIGIVTLVFGFVAIVVSLLYCMCICQEGKHLQPKHNGQVRKLQNLVAIYGWKMKFNRSRISFQYMIFQLYFSLSYFGLIIGKRILRFLKSKEKTNKNIGKIGSLKMI